MLLPQTLEALNQELAKVEDLARKKKAKLETAKKYHQFNANIDEEDAWVGVLFIGPWHSLICVVIFSSISLAVIVVHQTLLNRTPMIISTARRPFLAGKRPHQNPEEHGNRQ